MELRNMKKLLFIFNPISGKSRIKDQLYDVINFYTQNGYIVTTLPTQHARHAYEFLIENQNQYDAIICSGGDGTLNETVSALVKTKSQAQFGYLPSGSTNDFARSIGIPFELEKAMWLTVYGNEHCVDLGKMNDQIFVYVAAFGLFTNVAYATSQRFKNILGYLAYLLEGIRQISELRVYHIHLTYEDGVIEGDFIIGLITNSMSIGGFKNPRSNVVELDDGLFEVILIRKPNHIIELQSIIASLLSEKPNSPFITYLQSSRIQIESEEMSWTVDGEYGGNHKKVEITNLKQVFRVMGQ